MRLFYTLPHKSGGVLCFHASWQFISIHASVEHMYIVCFCAITFSFNLILILETAKYVHSLRPEKQDRDTQKGFRSKSSDIFSSHLYLYE